MLLNYNGWLSFYTHILLDLLTFSLNGLIWYELHTPACAHHLRRRWWTYHSCGHQTMMMSSAGGLQLHSFDVCSWLQRVSWDRWYLKGPERFYQWPTLWTTPRLRIRSALEEERRPSTWKGAATGEDTSSSCGVPPCDGGELKSKNNKKSIKSFIDDPISFARKSVTNWWYCITYCNYTHIILLATLGCKQNWKRSGPITAKSIICFEELLLIPFSFSRQEIHMAGVKWEVSIYGLLESVDLICNFHYHIISYHSKGSCFYNGYNVDSGFMTFEGKVACEWYN